MKVRELVLAMMNLNVNAEVKFKSNKNSDKIEVRPDDVNIYKQKVVTIVVGTKK